MYSLPDNVSSNSIIEKLLFSSLVKCFAFFCGILTSSRVLEKCVTYMEWILCKLLHFVGDTVIFLVHFIKRVTLNSKKTLIYICDVYNVEGIYTIASKNDWFAF